MKIEIKIADLAKLDAALQTVAGDVARLAVAGEHGAGDSEFAAPRKALATRMSCLIPA